MKFKSKNSNFWPDLLWNDPYTKIAVDIDKIWIYEHEQIKRVLGVCILHIVLVKFWLSLDF